MLGRTLLTAMLMLFFVSPSLAEEKFEEILARATKLKEEGKFSQAMSELTWASEQLQKLHAQKLQSFFPEAAEGVTGEKFEANSAMGLMVVERPYKTAEGGEIKVTLTGSSSANGAASQGMGALAGFAQMAAMMDQGQGSETVRVHGQRAQLNNRDGQLSLSVPLNAGMMLQIEQQSGKATKEQIVAIAEKFDVPGLNTYAGNN